jgi:tRNA G10  N-methylase Trm11
MPYKFARDRENYELYAGGGVLYSAPGHAAFPVRLAHEIFGRCMAYWEAGQPARRCTLYDPCGGGAYHLATLAYFNWDRIARIVASDIDAEMLALGARNLSLLSLDGLDRRIEEVADMAARFGKESHAAALAHARTLRERLAALTQDHAIETRWFRADATDKNAIVAGLDGTQADIVITDIPYGQRSTWHPATLALSAAEDPVPQLLDALLPGLSSGAVVAVAAPKRTDVSHERYRRLGKFTLGKRQTVFLQPSE